MLSSSPSRLRAKRREQRLHARANFPLSECLRHSERGPDPLSDVLPDLDAPAEPGQRPH